MFYPIISKDNTLKIMYHGRIYTLEEITLFVIDIGMNVLTHQDSILLHSAYENHNMWISIDDISIPTIMSCYEELIVNSRIVLNNL